MCLVYYWMKQGYVFFVEKLFSKNRIKTEKGKTDCAEHGQWITKDC